MQRKQKNQESNQNKHQFETMSTTKEQIYGQSPEQSHFEMVKVSIGFVRSLQDSVLRLEQNQQHLIAQLEHANSLATEYHETARIYHEKYNQALHEMNDLRIKHEHEIVILFDKIEEANRETESERAIKQIHAEQIELLERQIGQQVNYAAMSQARTITRNNDNDNDNHEILSPVSVASLSPRAPRYGYESPRLDPETSDTDADADADADNSEDEEEEDQDEDEDRDEEQSDNETEREFQMRYYHESLSSQTTDCSGDPIYHSDTDSD